MQTTQLLKRSLAYYWQTNLVVVLGVAIAVSVLAGALLIGESVRGSLRDLSSQRLGRTDDLISSATFFREQLGADLEQRGQFVANGIGFTYPLIALEGVVVHEPSKRRAGDVKVYGVTDRFWQFNGVAGVTAPQNREVLLSQSLATELGSGPGDSLSVVDASRQKHRRVGTPSPSHNRSSVMSAHGTLRHAHPSQ